MTRKRIEDIKSQKNAKDALVCLTAYTAPMAEALDPYCDMLLVGDSMGMTLYGLDSTRGVNLETMIRHGQAVMRHAQKACVIVDMPFGSYEESPQQALQNSRRIKDETGCDAVKLEGGQERAEIVAAIVKNGIPVMGHIGLTPQAVTDGKFRVKGRDAESEARLIADARALEKAGAFAIVIEGTQEDVAKKITQSISIPTIGIGASSACDGQVLVSEDMLGLHNGHIPKFVKQYARLFEEIGKAAASYAAEVRARKFPDENHVYGKK